MSGTLLDAFVAGLLTSYCWLMWTLTRGNWNEDRAHASWFAVDPYQDG